MITCQQFLKFCKEETRIKRVKKKLLKRLNIAILFFFTSFFCYSIFAETEDSESAAAISTSAPAETDGTQASAESSASSNTLDQKTMASLQAAIAKSPDLANKLQEILKTSPETQSTAASSQPDASQTLASATTSMNPTNQPQPENANMQSSSSSTTTAPTTQQQVVQPFVPWQPANAMAAQADSEAFSQIANQAFPLSPEQIQTLNNMLDETKRAQASAPQDRPPMPTSTSLIVNLSPGATPPVIRLSNGFVTSLVFIDSTGAPWPIEAYDLGNPSAFNIQWNKKSNMLMIQALSSYTYGNLAVKLESMNTPVMITLVPGQPAVDYRVDLRIQGIGPEAKPTIQGSGLPEQADKTLLDILDGISPPNSKKLQVSGGIAEAWEVGKILYVRTRFTLLSPAWVSKMSSADGMNAYKLQITPMLLVSRYGKVLELKIEGI